MNEDRILNVGADPQISQGNGGSIRGSTPTEQERTPEMIGAEIRMYVDAGRRAGVIIGLEIGRRLVEAKEMLNHGEWLPWLKRETGFSSRSAARYMQLFNECSADQLGIFGPEANSPALANLSITSAFNLLALPEDERESFIEEHNIESLSTREVEALVKERTAEIEAEKERLQESTMAAMSARDKATVEKIAAENARADAEEQLRRIRQELDEIEKRPQAVVYERDEEAIAKAANDAADAEREKHSEAEKKLKAKIAELEEQEKKNAENLRTAHDDIRKAKEDARDAREAVQKAQQAEAEAERLQRDVETLKKKLTLADPAVKDFSAAFDRAQDELGHMNTALHEIEDEEIKGKLLKASIAMLEGFLERVKE